MVVDRIRVARTVLFVIAIGIIVLCGQLLLNAADVPSSAVSAPIAVSSGRGGGSSASFDVLGDVVWLPRSDPRVEALLPPEGVPEYRRHSTYNVTCQDLGLQSREQVPKTSATPPAIFLFNTFNGEDDLLAIKLDEVYPVVDYFVIMESAVTFRGRPKPIYFTMNASSRFSKYREKIIHHVYQPTRQERATHFAVERRARFEAYVAVKDIIRRGDFILQSDLDEIPRREALLLLRTCSWDAERHLPAAFTLRYSYFSFEKLMTRLDWFAPRIHVFDPRNVYGSFYRHGDDAKGLRTIIPRAGWHCSWCFPLPEIVKKMTSFSHGSLDTKRNTNHTFLRDSLCSNQIFFHVGKSRMREEDKMLFDDELTPGNRNLGEADLPMYVIRNARHYWYLLPGDCHRKYPVKK